MLAAPTDPRMDFFQHPHQPLRFTQFNQPYATSPGQPVPPAHHVSQTTPLTYPGQPVPPYYPGQPAPGGKAKSRRALIVSLCVLLVLAVCALGITLYKLFSSDDSLAVGVKPAWDKPSKVVIEIKKEPRQAYTLYEPEKDKLLLLQPFKDDRILPRIQNLQKLIRPLQRNPPS